MGYITYRLSDGRGVMARRRRAGVYEIHTPAGVYLVERLAVTRRTARRAIERRAPWRITPPYRETGGAWHAPTLRGALAYALDEAIARAPAGAGMDAVRTSDQDAQPAPSTLDQVPPHARPAMLHHLQHNHFPPVPLAMAGPCWTAIRYTLAGEHDALVTIPAGAMGKRAASLDTHAWRVIRAFNLDGFIEIESMRLDGQDAAETYQDAIDATSAVL